MDHNKLYQDDNIAIILENNGRASISKITKLIKSQYFLIRDHIGQGDGEVYYCLTEEMWDGVFKN